MKFKLIAIALVATTVFISCKKEEKSSEEPVKAENNYFSVQVDASAAKTDDFALYYTEDGTNNFKDINAVWQGVRGGKPQVVEFKLPEEIVPTQVRLDFGLKKDQDSVVIKNVKVQYYGNSFEFKGSDFFKYFIKDEQFVTKEDAAAGTLTILQKEGTYTTPYFYPSGPMIEGIKKITTTEEATK